jgi:hypothetical protein
MPRGATRENWAVVWPADNLGKRAKAFCHGNVTQLSFYCNRIRIKFALHGYAEIQTKMKKAILTGAAALLLTLSAKAQETHFLPGHLAVLRAGDGVINLKLRQAPIFVDQFDADTPQAAPSFTVRIPTNGPDSFFFNGHAASEGNLTRSADQKLLAFGGYGGADLLRINGTASRLDVLRRGICTVDNSGTFHIHLYRSVMKEAKVNPRGVVTDGTNNFWGCGNANNTYYYNPSQQQEPVQFDALPSTRSIKIINNALYVSMNTADGALIDQPAGLYSFLPLPLPRQANTSIKLTVPAAEDYDKVVGFDISPDGNIAYMADTAAGIQKYVNFEGTWKLAYNFSIPQNIPQKLNNAAGCFGLLVDFSGAAPVLYATTTEGYDGAVNSNRVVRIVDTNSTALVTTLAQAGSTNIAFRGIAFTPN